MPAPRILPANAQRNRGARRTRPPKPCGLRSMGDPRGAVPVDTGDGGRVRRAPEGLPRPGRRAGGYVGGWTAGVGRTRRLRGMHRRARDVPPGHPGGIDPVGRASTGPSSCTCRPATQRRAPAPAGAAVPRRPRHRHADGIQLADVAHRRPRGLRRGLPRRRQPQLERRWLLRPAGRAGDRRRPLRRRPAGPPGVPAVPRPPPRVRRRHVERRHVQPPPGLRPVPPHRRHRPRRRRQRDDGLHPRAARPRPDDPRPRRQTRPLGRRHGLRHRRRPLHQRPRHHCRGGYSATVARRQPRRWCSSRATAAANARAVAPPKPTSSCAPSPAAATPGPAAPPAASTCPPASVPATALRAGHSSPANRCGRSSRPGRCPERRRVSGRRRRGGRSAGRWAPVHPATGGSGHSPA